MARDAIQWSASTPDQQSLRSDIRALDEVVYRLQRHLDYMNHLNDESNFSDLESVYGVVAGMGDNLRNELASCIGKLETTGQGVTVEAVKDARKQLVAIAG